MGLNTAVQRRYQKQPMSKRIISKITNVTLSWQFLFNNNTLTGTKFDPCALFELNFLIKFYFIYHILFLVN
jgi:hypothetical protein